MTYSFQQTARGLFATLLVVLISGCSLVQYQEKGTASRHLDAVIDSLEISQEFSEARPFKVAIIPFKNTTGNNNALEIVRQTFYNQFASKRYIDVELFEIDTILKENGLYENDKLLLTPTKKLGELLQADALIYGTISGFNRMFLGLYSQVWVELEVVLVNSSSGEVLWRAKHKSTTRQGDMPLDPLSLIPAMFRTTMNLSNKALQQTTDELCRTLASVLPEPEPLKI